MAQASRRSWRRLTAETAAAHLTEWKRSGKTLSDYARDVGLSYQRLHRWRMQLGTSDAAERPAFVPVRVTETEVIGASSSEAALELHTPGGLRILVPSGIDDAALERLLRVVRRASC